MKPKEIKWGKNKEHTILVDREFFNSLFGIILIISCALMSGILQLMTVGFNFKLISSYEFWTGYLIKIIIGYTCLFGCYLLKKSSNRKSNKFVVQRAKIQVYRDRIVKEGKVQDIRSWLTKIYNYRKKVERYHDIILKKFEKLEIEEPVVPNKEDYTPLEGLNKIKYQLLMHRYRRFQKKYLMKQEYKKYLEKQLEVCKVHFQIIDSYRKNDLERVRELQADLKDDDMKSYKIKIERVTYNKLFNFDLSSEIADDSINYQERKFVSKHTIPFAIISLILFCLLASMTPLINDVSITTILMIFFNMVVIGWNAFSGMMLANNFVWNVVYNADSNRLAILEEFSEDSHLIESKEEGN